MTSTRGQANVLETFRARLAEVGYTTDRIADTLGHGRVSFSPADLAVHERRLPSGEPFSLLVKLFLLGLSLSAEEVGTALGPVDPEELAGAGWLETHGRAVRATRKLVPHGELLIGSDRDSDGPTSFDWVAGIHPPSATLAKLSVRRPVARALDVATGNGVQALLASRHAQAVVATDINPRAVAAAGANARLNGVSNIEFRQGSFFEPVAGERFDLVTCNPPYVISPEARYAYRDSGLLGDTVSRQVVAQAPALLNEGGFAHILISWAHRPDDWSSPVAGWVDASGCDSWLLYFGSDDPVTYASEWLKPVAWEDPGRFRDRLGRWLDYFADLDIAAIAHGAVILRRRSSGANWTRTDRVSLDRLEQASDHILRVFEAQDYLNSLRDDRQLLKARFALVPDHRLEQTLVCHEGRAEPRSTVLSVEDGLAFQIGLDEHTAQLIPLLDGRGALHDVLARRAIEMNLGRDDAARFEAAALPAVHRLLQLGFLVRHHATEGPPAV